MSKSVNNVRLLGNLGQNPEAKESRAGLVVNLSIATNERKKQGDAWVDHTEWHRAVCFGRTAEIAKQYLHKGSKVYVTGRLRTNSWDDNGTRRWSTNVMIEDLILLDGGGASSNGQARPPEPPEEAYDSEAF